MRLGVIRSLGLLMLSGSPLYAQSITVTEDEAPASATYNSLSSTITLSTDIANGTNATAATTSGASNSSSSTDGTLLVGTNVQTMSNGTTTGPSQPGQTNLSPCNGYVEFCQRNYSNITWVGAHNSPFYMENNAASNQKYGVIAQLNDGIRLLQGQTHLVNGTMRYCHTSCDLLDAGTVEDYFGLVAAWLAASRNRFEVVTIIIGNSDTVNVENYTAAIENSGLRRFAFEPEKVPMTVHEWPTLSQMIALDKRAVIFMDYEANQTAVPYILDEFSYIWETPFSPQNSSFPCTVQRPPDIKDEGIENRMFLLNNNLNAELQLFGSQILIPNLAAINTTNAAFGQGSLGVSTNGCVADWGRAPNFLILDYYEAGNFPGSTFQVAARANGVHYQPGDCCGKSVRINVAGGEKQVSLAMLSLTLFAVAYTALL